MATMTVEDLLSSRFPMRILAGWPGTTRHVGWVHISTTSDIADWIEPDDLVVTGGGNLPRGRKEQGALVRRLARRGAAGLALGGRDVPDDISGLIEAADEVGLALIEIDRAVPWGGLGRTVAIANQAGADSRLSEQLRVFDTLRSRLNGDLGLAEALARHSRLTGYDFYLVNTRHRPALPGLPLLPTETTVAGIVNRSSVEDGYALPITVGRKTIATLIALENRERPSGLATVQHVATLLALELSEVEREREILRRSGARLFGQLRAGSLPVNIAVKSLMEHGLNVGRGLIVLTVRVANSEDEMVERFLTDDPAAHLSATFDGAGVFLISADSRHVVDEIAETLSGPIGLSAFFYKADDIGLAVRQAKWMLDRNPSIRRAKVLSFESVAAHASWLPPQQEALLDLVRRVLGPLIRYDQTNSAELARTLRTYLQTNLSTRESAEVLGVHEHTISYRLRRCAAILDRDVRSTETIAEAWLAFNAIDVIEAETDIMASAFMRTDGS
ncbi:PucR family transcriptional regulator ligand-binding domain-containing protein [Mycetocola sp. 2940]|uniref:PucR family transcriptional regulator n=1 Tax=Mycetocola sp. 2940 TaxID=3156452 RepID=UPI00339364FE